MGYVLSFIGYKLPDPETVDKQLLSWFLHSDAFLKVIQ